MRPKKLASSDARSLPTDLTWLLIGNFPMLFAITDKVHQDDYPGPTGNSCTVPIG